MSENDAARPEMSDRPQVADRAHQWDLDTDVCAVCKITREQYIERGTACRKPRFGDGAPAGFGAPNFVGRAKGDGDERHLPRHVT